MSEADNRVLDPLLPAQCDISEEDGSDQDREPEGCEPPAPDSHQAATSSPAAKPRPPPHGLSSNLSFFDDYDIVDGIPRTTLDVGNADLSRIRFSKNGLKVAVHDGKENCIRIFDVFGRGQKVVIKMEGLRKGDFRFEGDSDDVIVCINGSGQLTKWKREEKVLEFEGPWSFGDSPQFFFSDCGQYLSLVCKVEGKSSIACYGIRHAPHSVKEVKKVALAIRLKSPIIRFSPDSRDLLVTEEGDLLRQSPDLPAGSGDLVSGSGDLPSDEGDFLYDERDSVTLVWLDFTSRDTGFKLEARNARFIGDGIIVQSDNIYSYLWKIDRQSGGRSPVSHQSVMMEKEPDMEFPGSIAGVCGDKAVGRMAEDICAWDLAAFSILFQEECLQVVMDVCPFPDGKWFAAVEARGTLSVWDAQRLVRIWETKMPLEEYGRDQLICPGGSKVVCARQGCFYVFHFEALESKDELLFETDGLEPEQCVFSCDAAKVGTLDGWGNVLIWNLCDGSNSQFKVEGTLIEQFCFSLDGTRMATVSMGGQVALWTIEGRSSIVMDCSQLCDIQELVDDFFDVSAVSFAKNEGGQEVVVILTKLPARFEWIDMEGNVAFTADLNADSACAHRFSVNCEQCVVLVERNRVMVTEVWDLVSRRKLIRSENVVHSVFQDFADEQLVMDGSKLLKCNKEGDDPELIVFRKLEDISVLSNVDNGDSDGEYIDRCQTAALSQDGQYLATCVRIDEGLRRRVTVQHVGQDDASFVPFSEIDFIYEREDGRLFMSDNGERIAWATRNDVKVWSPHSERRCMPSYDRLRNQSRTSDRAVLTKLLDGYGKNLLTFPNGAGWTFLARAIEDANTDCVRAIMEWTKSNEKCLLLYRSNVDMEEGSKWTNLLELALTARLPECIQVLLNGTLDGALGGERKDEVLAKPLGMISEVYPMIAVDTWGDSRLLHKNGETWYSQRAFERKPFVVCTSDESIPEDLEDFWSQSVHSLVKSNIWGFLKTLSFGRKEETGREDARKVPANSYVVLACNFAKVGTEGLLSKALTMEMAEKVFATLPMKAMVEYKMDVYGRDLVFANMCCYVLLLVCFTVYSLLIGVGCQGSSGLGFGLDIACGVLLGLSMVMSAFGLYGELKQLVTYWKEGRGFWFYWADSKWNAMEFLTYVLIAAAIPTFHFGGNPCNSPWGISWAVPLVDVMLWWKVLYFAQAFQSTGPMVLMIFAIIKDILFFLLIGFGVLLGFGMGFFVLFREDEKEAFDTIGNSMLGTFAMMLGDFDLDLLQKSHAPVVAIVLFVAYMLVMAIVLLNLLIAIMGDSFDRIKESEEQHFVMVRASIIDDMESMLSAARRDTINEGIGEYLHVLLPKDHIEEVGEWHGRMLELKKHFENTIWKSEARQQKRVDDLEAKMDKSLAQVEATQKDTMKILEKVESAMVGGRAAAIGEAE